MPRYAIYTPQDGVIRKVITGPANLLVGNTPAGHDWLEVPQDVRPRTHRIEAGSAVPFELEPTEADLTERLRQLRQARIWAGVEVSGVQVDTRPEDISTLLGLREMVAAGLILEPISFKGGGVFHDITAADLEAIVAAAANHVQMAYAAERAVLVRVRAGALKTFADLDAAWAAEAGQ